MQNNEFFNVVADSIFVGPIGDMNITINAKTKKLAASFNLISNVTLEPAAEFQLTSLNLSNNLLTDVSQFSKLINLEEIDFSNNQIESFDVIPSALVNLERIYLQNNKLIVFHLEQFNPKSITKYTITDRYFIFIAYYIYEAKIAKVSIDLSGNPWLNSSDAL